MSTPITDAERKAACFSAYAERPSCAMTALPIAPPSPMTPAGQSLAPAHGSPRSLSGHQSAAMKSEVWLTPPEILQSLGPFDLDPCAPSVRPWEMARDHISLPADGLAAEWWGRVWLNPPFGTKAAAWLRKMKAHGNGIALIPARTETAMFYESVWGGGDAVCFLKGRPHFHHVDGTRAPFNSGAPICLVAYGLDNVEALKRASLGVVVRWANV